MRSLIFGDKSNPVDEMSTIFADPKAGFDWAHRVLAAANIDAARNPNAAIKELRSQDPALKLKTATYMVKRINAS